MPGRNPYVPLLDEHDARSRRSCPMNAREDRPRARTASAASRGKRTAPRRRARRSGWRYSRRTRAVGNGTRSSPATLSDRSTTRSGRLLAHCRRRARAASRSPRCCGRRMRGRRGRDRLARAGARGGRRGPARSAHALDGARPCAADGRRTAATRARHEGGAAREQRVCADALLRGRLVHGRRRRRGVRRARLRGLHASRGRARRTSPTESAWASLATPARSSCRRAACCSRSPRRTRSATWPALVRRRPLPRRRPRLLPRHRPPRSPPPAIARACCFALLARARAAPPTSTRSRASSLASRARRAAWDDVARRHRALARALAPQCRQGARRRRRRVLRRPPLAGRDVRAVPPVPALARADRVGSSGGALASRRSSSSTSSALALGIYLALVLRQLVYGRRRHPLGPALARGAGGVAASSSRRSRCSSSRRQASTRQRERAPGRRPDPRVRSSSSR